MHTPPVFRSDIAAIYDRLLVPMIFESYAVEPVARIATRLPQRVLEVAAGYAASPVCSPMRYSVMTAFSGNSTRTADGARRDDARRDARVRWLPRRLRWQVAPGRGAEILNA
jgi:hypothetical protein